MYNIFDNKDKDNKEKDTKDKEKMLGRRGTRIGSFANLSNVDGSTVASEDDGTSRPMSAQSLSQVTVGGANDGAIGGGGHILTWEESDDPKAVPPSFIRVLILIGMYARAATTMDEEESWIRSVALWVMLYEGITAGVLDFDYAPSNVLVQQDGKSRRIWMNLTQEGKSCVDWLRENGYVNALKLSTEDFTSITAFQVSLKGIEKISNIPADVLTEIKSFCHGPRPFENELIYVEFNGEDFELTTVSGFRRISAVGDIEDVSYVSSPYIPACLRTSWGKILTTNAHRTRESALGVSNIRDELSEALHLSFVNLIVGEYLPFGPNQIAALNERLGSLDRCQGGLFTAQVDKNPGDTQFRVPTGLTQVRIVDFDLTQFLNIEAEINYPEESGVVQIEHFGIHVDVDGSVLYCMKIDAIMDREADSINLDMLSRLLVDVHQDSSKIMGDLISTFQRSMLHTIFMGEPEKRGKFNLILADEVHPKLPASKYLDRDDNENELKQVVGDIVDAHDIGEDDVLINGRDGVVFVGLNAKKNEHIMTHYLSLLTMNQFLSYYHGRCLLLDDTLKKTRQVIVHHETDPNNVQRIREALNVASRDVVLLSQTLAFVEESLALYVAPAEPYDAAGKKLFEVLEFPKMTQDVRTRIGDLAKLIQGSEQELNSLVKMSDIFDTLQLESELRKIEKNTRGVLAATEVSEQGTRMLEGLVLIMGTLLAFEIVDRLSGSNLNISPPDWFIQNVKQPLMDPPGIWILVHIAIMIVVMLVIAKISRWLQAKMQRRTLIIRSKVNKRIDKDGMNQYIATKKLITSHIQFGEATELKTCKWEETDKSLWHGQPPMVELVIDQYSMFLLEAIFTLDQSNLLLTDIEILDIFLRELVDVGAMDQKEAFPETATKEQNDEAVKA